MSPLTRSSIRALAPILLAVLALGALGPVACGLGTQSAGAQVRARLVVVEHKQRRGWQLAAGRRRQGRAHRAVGGDQGDRPRARTRGDRARVQARLQGGGRDLRGGHHRAAAGQPGRRRPAAEHRPLAVWLMAESGRVVARSYRSVFALERRIFRIDRVRLNPTGIPVRGVVYVAVIAGLIALLARLPVTGWALALMPDVIRTLGLPVVLGTLASVVRVDGRPLHAAVGCLVAFAVRPRTLWLLQPYRRPRPWQPIPIVFVAAGSSRRSGAFASTVRAPPISGSPTSARSEDRRAAGCFASPVGARRTPVRSSRCATGVSSRPGRRDENPAAFRLRQRLPGRLTGRRGRCSSCAPTRSTASPPRPSVSASGRCAARWMPPAGTCS